MLKVNMVIKGNYFVSQISVFAPVNQSQVCKTQNLIFCSVTVNESWQPDNLSINTNWCQKVLEYRYCEIIDLLSVFGGEWGKLHFNNTPSMLHISLQEENKHRSKIHRVCRMEAQLQTPNQSSWYYQTTTKPNQEVSGWLYQTKTYTAHIVYQPFLRVKPPNYIALSKISSKEKKLYYSLQKKKLLTYFLDY